jgi:hypothetical protein
MRPKKSALACRPVIAEHYDAAANQLRINTIVSGLSAHLMAKALSTQKQKQQQMS